jgi:hypothetical protein
MRKLSIPIKLVISLVCGMISVTMLSVQWFPAEYLPTTVIRSTATVVAPFVNLSDMLMVEIEFYPDAEPQVISVLPLAEGRMTPSGVGEVLLKVVDPHGKVVYETSLDPAFVFGEPAKKHDSIRMTFIIPNAGRGGKIQISSADWTMEYTIDGN